MRVACKKRANKNIMSNNIFMCVNILHLINTIIISEFTLEFRIKVTSPIAYNIFLFSSHNKGNKRHK